MAARIAKRLAEQDLDYAEGVLTAAVKRCKRVRPLAGKDDLILSHAVRMAVEHARTGRHHPATMTADGDLDAAETTTTDAETVLLE